MISLLTSHEPVAICRNGLTLSSFVTIERNGKHELLFSDGQPCNGYRQYKIEEKKGRWILKPVEIIYDISRRRNMAIRTTSTFTYQGVSITWMGHDTFRIQGPPTIYIDPYQIKVGPKADYILISHDHFDHFSKDDIKKVATDQTTFITVKQVAQQLNYQNVKTVKPSDTFDISPDLGIEAVPAYNVNKFRAPGQPFHPKEAGYTGFMVQFKGVRIYHTGDSDFIPEMRSIRTDVALLPVSGIYVMTAAEAAEAAKTLMPRIAVPMHWGSLLASMEDAKRFQQLVPKEVQVVILQKE